MQSVGQSYGIENSGAGAGALPISVYFPTVFEMPPALKGRCGRRTGDAGGGTGGASAEPIVKNGTIGPVESPTLPAPDADSPAPAYPSGGGKALAGFLLSGFLLALLGAILPAWDYHHDLNFAAVGNYFLSLAVGVVAASLLARPIMARRGLTFLLVFACSLSCCAGLPGPGFAAAFRLVEGGRTFGPGNRRRSAQHGAVQRHFPKLYCRFRRYR